MRYHDEEPLFIRGLAFRLIVSGLVLVFGGMFWLGWVG